MTDDPKPRPCVKPAAGGGFEAQDCDTDFAHANLSWITADQVYLARVEPSPETINDIKSYEFFGGHGANGKPVWTGDFDKIKPLIEWNNNMGCVTATWVPGLKKYLMCITDGWPTVAKMNSYILEGDMLTGPWRMVVYLKDFGEQAYFLNFPSKFVSLLFLYLHSTFRFSALISVYPPLRVITMKKTAFYWTVARNGVINPKNATKYRISHLKLALYMLTT